MTLLRLRRDVARLHVAAGHWVVAESRRRSPDILVQVGFRLPPIAADRQGSERAQVASTKDRSLDPSNADSAHLE